MILSEGDALLLIIVWSFLRFFRAWVVFWFSLWKVDKSNPSQSTYSKNKLNNTSRTIMATILVLISFWVGSNIWWEAAVDHFLWHNLWEVEYKPLLFWNRANQAAYCANRQKLLMRMKSSAEHHEIIANESLNGCKHHVVSLECSPNVQSEFQKCLNREKRGWI